MPGCCKDPPCSAAGGGTDRFNDPAWRRVLWIALVINAGMFVTEVSAGLAANSAALQADALDFMGDAANYAVSLGVAGLGLAWRARAALVKGSGLLLLGFWVAGSAAWHMVAGIAPRADVMGIVGILALVANGAVAVMLFRFRGGDANMRSVWICSRNDAVGNIAVLVAAGGVFGTGAGWPDLLVAAVMAGLGLSGGWQILRQARQELRADHQHSESYASRLPKPEATVCGKIPTN